MGIECSSTGEEGGGGGRRKTFQHPFQTRAVNRSVRTLRGHNYFAPSVLRVGHH